MRRSKGKYFTKMCNHHDHQLLRHGHANLVLYFLDESYLLFIGTSKDDHTSIPEEFRRKKEWKWKSIFVSHCHHHRHPQKHEVECYYILFQVDTESRQCNLWKCATKAGSVCESKKMGEKLRDFFFYVISWNGTGVASGEKKSVTGEREK